MFHVVPSPPYAAPCGAASACCVPFRVRPRQAAGASGRAVPAAGAAGRAEAALLHCCRAVFRGVVRFCGGGWSVLLCHVDNVTQGK